MGQRKVLYVDKLLQKRESPLSSQGLLPEEESNSRVDFWNLNPGIESKLVVTPQRQRRLNWMHLAQMLHQDALHFLMPSYFQQILTALLSFLPEIQIRYEKLYAQVL